MDYASGMQTGYRFNLYMVLALIVRLGGAGLRLTAVQRAKTLSAYLLATKLLALPMPALLIVSLDSAVLAMSAAALSNLLQANHLKPRRAKVTPMRYARIPARMDHR